MDTLKNLNTAVANQAIALLNVQTSVTSTILQTIKDQLNSFPTSIPNSSLKNFIERLRTSITSIPEAVSAAIGNPIVSIVDNLQKLSVNWPTLDITPIVSGINEIISDIEAALDPANVNVNLGDLPTLLKTAMDDLNIRLQSAANGASADTKEVLDAIRSQVDSVVANALVQINKSIEVAKDAGRAILNYTTDVLKQIRAQADQIITNVLDTVKSTVADLQSNYQNVITGIANVPFNVLRLALNMAGINAKLLQNSLTLNVETVKGMIADADTIMQTIINSGRVQLDNALSNVDTVANNFANLLKTMYNDAVAAGSSRAETCLASVQAEAKTSFDSVVEAAKKCGGDLENSLRTTISTVASPLVAFLKTISNKSLAAAECIAKYSTAGVSATSDCLTAINTALNNEVALIKTTYVQNIAGAQSVATDFVSCSNTARDMATNAQASLEASFKSCLAAAA